MNYLKILKIQLTNSLRSLLEEPLEIAWYWPETMLSPNRSRVATTAAHVLLITRTPRFLITPSIKIYLSLKNVKFIKTYKLAGDLINNVTTFWNFYTFLYQQERSAIPINVTLQYGYMKKSLQRISDISTRHTIFMKFFVYIGI